MQSTASTILLYRQHNNTFVILLRCVRSRYSFIIFLFDILIICICIYVNNVLYHYHIVEVSGVKNVGEIPRRAKNII